MNDSEIKQLLQINAKIVELIQEKQDQLIVLEKQIEKLTESKDLIDRLISQGSFTTADMINHDLSNAETAASTESIDYENIKVSRKIFSPEGDLLASMSFNDQIVHIRFPHAEKTGINNEIYISEFVKPVLVPLKKIEEKLTQEIHHVIINGEEVVSVIKLLNLQSFESFEFIFEKLESFLLHRA